MNTITLRTRESLIVELEASSALNESYIIQINQLRIDCEAYRTEPPSVLQDEIDELKAIISTIEDNAESEQRELDLFNKVQKLEELLKTVVITAQNRKDRMHELQRENDELKNRRD